MKKIYTLNAVTDFLAGGLVDNFKITKVQKVGFNEREGSIYHVNIKIKTVEGYKNKLVTFVINSTYLDEMDNSETIEEYLENWFFSFLYI